MHNGGYIDPKTNTKVDTWATPPDRYKNYYKGVGLPYVSRPASLAASKG